MAGSLFGQRGVALIAVAITAMVPLLNLLAIYVFIRFAGQPRQARMRSCVHLPQPLHLVLRDRAHPQLSGPAAAAAAGTLRGIDGPRGARRRVCSSSVRASASAALPRPGLPHVISGVLKLLILPLIVVSVARMAGVRGRSRGGGYRLVGALASAAFVLARQMGGNALMAEILTLQTLLAMGSMPLLIILLG